MVVDPHGKFMGLGVRSEVGPGKHFMTLSPRQIEFSALSILFSGNKGKTCARGVIFHETGAEQCRKAAPPHHLLTDENAFGISYT